MISPDDLVFLFADLQPALVRHSATNPPALVEAGAEALAKAARILGVPVLFSVVPEQGRPGTHLPALEAYVTEENCFPRETASPFQDERFVAALEETRRHTLVIAGFSTEAVTLFTSLHAIAAGYSVVVALDAGGAKSDRTEAAALRRIERAGGTVTAVMDIVMSCAPDFSRSPGKDTFAVVHDLMSASTDQLRVERSK